MKTTITAPVIELRKFHFAEWASEETNCFDAEVWIDGKPAFHAKNEGRGGCDHYTPIYRDGASDRAAFDVGMSRLKEYAATLPAKDYEGLSLQPDVETLIGDAVNGKLREKDRAKFMRRFEKEIVLLRGGKIYTVKAPPRFLPLTAENARTFPVKPGGEVLNLLSPDEAWAKIQPIVFP